MVALLAAAYATGAAHAADPRILVFSKTAEYRHDSIPAGIQAIRDLGAKNGFAVTATEDASTFTAAGLAPYAAVVFLLTTGDVLDPQQQAAFEAYIRAGHGYAGVHSASDTEREWPWYGRLVGAWSSGHPEIQQATIDVVTPRDASTAALPARWTRTDEWYGFLTNPRANGVRVLLTLDETTYQPREYGMPGDHPIAWEHDFDGGRAWYTQGGHTADSYAEPLFLGHLLGGIKYAIGSTTPPAVAKPVAPKLSKLTLSVRGGRLAVSAKYSGACARCTATIRVASKTKKLAVRWSSSTGTVSGTTAVLPAGRWQASLVLTNPAGAVRKTTRTVQIPKP